MAVAPNEEDKGGAAAPRSEAAQRLAARRQAKAAAKAAKRGTAPIVPTGVTKGVESARSFFEEHGRRVLLGIGVGILLAVLGLTISAYLDKQASAASELLFAGVEAAKAPVIDPAQAPAEADEAEESFPSVEARAK